jgi:uracil-DNA glycosylase
MTRSPPSLLARDIAAALDWWREAGVDAAFADTPRAWLAEPADEALAAEIAVPAAEPPPEPERRIGGPRAAWPTELAGFGPWWLSEPTLDDGGLNPRVAPRGPAKAELMVLVAMPEAGDREALLSGPEGGLLKGFLRAAGLPSQGVYRASAIPRHISLPDWRELERQGVGKVLAHHVALVRPRRLLILGQNILPLCGHDPAQGAQNLRSFNHEGGRVPAMAEAGLDRLLGNPALRARWWRRWLDWAGEDLREDGP